jgi:hypothetical protein
MVMTYLGRVCCALRRDEPPKGALIFGVKLCDVGISALPFLVPGAIDQNNDTLHFASPGPTTIDGTGGSSLATTIRHFINDIYPMPP